MRKPLYIFAVILFITSLTCTELTACCFTNKDVHCEANDVNDFMIVLLGRYTVQENFNGYADEWNFKDFNSTIVGGTTILRWWNSRYGTDPCLMQYCDWVHIGYAVEEDINLPARLSICTFTDVNGEPVGPNIPQVGHDVIWTDPGRVALRIFNNLEDEVPTTISNVSYAIMDEELPLEALNANNSALMSQLGPLAAGPFVILPDDDEQMEIPEVMEPGDVLVYRFEGDDFVDFGQHEMGPQFGFEQLDWIGLATSTPDSNWGRISLEFTPDPCVRYFNLKVDDNWVIQNMSVHDSNSDFSTSLTTFFDLGVPHGTDVNNLNYVASLDYSPRSTTPVGPNIPAIVADLDYQIGGEGGVDLGSPGPVDRGPLSTAKVVKKAELPNIGDVNNQEQGANQCVPGAVSTSLKYLQSQGSISEDLATDIEDVAEALGTDEDGTDQGWPTTKQEHYKDDVITTIITDLADIDTVMEELERGQDVELDLDGHAAMVGAIRKKDDGSIDIDVYDDNQKGDGADEMRTTSIVDGKVDGMDFQAFIIECPNDAVAEDCFPSDHPDYAKWLQVGSLPCWCPAPAGSDYQCKGDADGLFDGKDQYGKRQWVVKDDYDILAEGWQKFDGPNGEVGSWICADFDHAFDGKDQNGKRQWVVKDDYDILAASWQKFDNDTVFTTNPCFP